MYALNFGIFMQGFDLKKSFMLGVLNLEKFQVFKLSILHFWSKCVTFIFWKKPNQVVRNERLVSNLVCAYYLKSVAFQQASFVGMSLIKDWRYLGDSTLAPEILTYLNCPHVMGNTYSTFLDLYNVHTISLGRTIVSWIYYFELIAGLSYMTCQNHFQIGYR